MFSYSAYADNLIDFNSRKKLFKNKNDWADLNEDDAEKLNSNANLLGLSDGGKNIQVTTRGAITVDTVDGGYILFASNLDLDESSTAKSLTVYGESINRKNSGDVEDLLNGFLGTSISLDHSYLATVEYKDNDKDESKYQLALAFSGDDVWMISNVQENNIDNAATFVAVYDSNDNEICRINRSTPSAEDVYVISGLGSNFVCPEEEESTVEIDGWGEFDYSKSDKLYTSKDHYNSIDVCDEVPGFDLDINLVNGISYDSMCISGRGSVRFYRPPSLRTSENDYLEIKGFYTEESDFSDIAKKFKVYYEKIDNINDINSVAAADIGADLDEAWIFTYDLQHKDSNTKVQWQTVVGNSGSDSYVLFNLIKNDLENSYNSRMLINQDGKTSCSGENSVGNSLVFKLNGSKFECQESSVDTSCGDDSAYKSGAAVNYYFDSWYGITAEITCSNVGEQLIEIADNFVAGPDLTETYQCDSDGGSWIAPDYECGVLQVVTFELFNFGTQFKIFNKASQFKASENDDDCEDFSFDEGPFPVAGEKMFNSVLVCPRGNLKFYFDDDKFIQISGLYVGDDDLNKGNIKGFKAFMQERTSTTWIGEVEDKADIGTSHDRAYVFTSQVEHDNSGSTISDFQIIILVNNDLSSIQVVFNTIENNHSSPVTSSIDVYSGITPICGYEVNTETGISVVDISDNLQCLTGGRTECHDNTGDDHVDVVHGDGNKNYFWFSSDSDNEFGKIYGRLTCFDGESLYPVISSGLQTLPSETWFSCEYDPDWYKWSWTAPDYLCDPTAEFVPCNDSNNFDCANGICLSNNYEVICECKLGWTNSPDSRVCNLDVNECDPTGDVTKNGDLSQLHQCPSWSTCRNLNIANQPFAGYTCECDPNYYNPPGFSDSDEARNGYILNGLLDAVLGKMHNFQK